MPVGASIAALSLPVLMIVLCLRAARLRSRAPEAQPLCLDCYDHDAHVIWNHHAGELWRRTSIGLRRAVTKLGRRHGVPLGVAFGKVAEYQARGVVHFHALIRLDALIQTPGGPIHVSPPDCISVDELAAALREPCASTYLRTARHPDSPDGAVADPMGH